MTELKPLHKMQGLIFRRDFFIKVLPSHLIFDGDFFIKVLPSHLIFGYIVAYNVDFVNRFRKILYFMRFSRCHSQMFRTNKHLPHFRISLRFLLTTMSQNVCIVYIFFFCNYYCTKRILPFCALLQT